MITREEYNKALDLIEAYHKQINLDKERITNYNRVSISNFYAVNCKNMSRRLRHGFLSIIEDARHTYVDELTKRNFLRTRNIGMNSWIEFNELNK